MGRPLGAKNRTTQQAAFVARVERFLKESDPGEYKSGDALARKCARIIEAEDIKTAAILLAKILPYKIGLPVQPIEHSGSLGLADVVRMMRERVAKGRE